MKAPNALETAASDTHTNDERHLKAFVRKWNRKTAIISLYPSAIEGTTMMNIEITQEYKSSLIPFSRGLLEPLDLPKETFDFLAEVGLPLHSNYEITPNAPLTFLSTPTIKQYPYLQRTYLHFGSLDVMGELAINLYSQSVQQIQITNENGYDMAIPYLVNYSLSQFIDCLGLWLTFYPQLRDEIARNLECDPKFSLFEHEEIYEPILKKLKEVDPKSMRQRKFFWRRMCEPDIV